MSKMQEVQSAPPAPAAPAIAGVATNSPVAVYKAMEAQRKELGQQLQELESKRRSITNQLDEGVAGAAKAGLETRIADIDKRIADVDKQIAGADAAVAKAAAIPGAVVEPPRYERPGPPDEVYLLTALFMVVCVLPLSVAYARRMWKRTATAITSLPHEMMERFTRLEQAVDSVAIEVERIGEGQRFVTRVLAENGSGRALQGGAAVPVSAAAQPEAVPVSRKMER